MKWTKTSHIHTHIVAVCVEAGAEIRELPESAADQQDHRGELVSEARRGFGDSARLLPIARHQSQVRHSAFVLVGDYESKGVSKAEEGVVCGEVLVEKGSTVLVRQLEY